MISFKGPFTIPSYIACKTNKIVTFLRLFPPSALLSLHLYDQFLLPSVKARELLRRYDDTRTRPFPALFWILISLIISAPYGIHPKFSESMAQNFLCGLQHVAFSPKWLSQPIAQFTLVLTVCHIRVALQFQFNGTDCFPILFSQMA